MFEQLSTTFKQTPEDRSKTFNTFKPLPEDLSNTLTILQTPSKPCAPVCAPVGRTDMIVQ
eukprot:4679784-Heterocapsa_arctica.AAC.1